MKKILLKILLIIFLIPLNVCALQYNNISYNITDYYIEANILENGDMLVNELIVLDGTFNGYIRDILYTNPLSESALYNASNLEIINIAAKNIVKEVNFATINDNDFITLNTSDYYYTESGILGGKSYKMYFATKGKSAFKITYLLKDVAILHEDVAEVYWNFIGDEFDDEINNLNIKINLPNVDETTNFRTWAHGDLSGTVYMHDNLYVLANASNISQNSPVDVRLTFSKNLLNEDLVTKKTSETSLPKIIEEEENRALIANQERKKARIIYYGILALTFIWYIAFLISLFYVYFKYDKEHKSNFKNKYNREFIEDYNVEVVDYLFHKNNISSNAFTASIMNLVYKKNLKLEEIALKNKKDYQFTLINKDNTNETEKYLIDLLFNEVGHDNTLKMSDLKKYAENTKTCEAFNSKYTLWKKLVIGDGEKCDLFEKKKTQNYFGVGIFLSSLFLTFLVIITGTGNILTLLSSFWGMCFLIYTLVLTKRTIKGNDDYVKWKSFKNFLNDFGNFEIKELPEIVLWEKYLVYATVLGLAKKVSKSMNIKITEYNSNLNSGYYPTFYDYYVFNNIIHSIDNVIHSNVNAITTKRANSINSSGSGFGGGFSSGGGFGGGGGGGRGF